MTPTGSPIDIAPELLASASEHASAIVSELAGIAAVVIATTDGFEVSLAVRREVDAARISALASSIVAIGEVVSSEAKLGSSRCVTIETESGFAVAQRVARKDLPMVIMILGGADAVLAQVKYRAAAAASALERL
jgi:uncharacterized protein